MFCDAVLWAGAVKEVRLHLVLKAEKDMNEPGGWVLACLVKFTRPYRKVKMVFGYFPWYRVAWDVGLEQSTKRPSKLDPLSRLGLRYLEANHVGKQYISWATFASFTFVRVHYEAGSKNVDIVKLSDGPSEIFWKYFCEQLFRKDNFKERVTLGRTVLRYSNIHMVKVQMVQRSQSSWLKKKWMSFLVLVLEATLLVFLVSPWRFHVSRVYREVQDLRELVVQT